MVRFSLWKGIASKQYNYNYNYNYNLIFVYIYVAMAIEDDEIDHHDEDENKSSGGIHFSFQSHKKIVIGMILLANVFHFVYLISIFDIYFRTPLVHGMKPHVSDLT